MGPKNRDAPLCHYAKVAAAQSRHVRAIFIVPRSPHLFNPGDGKARGIRCLRKQLHFICVSIPLSAGFRARLGPEERPR